MNYPRRIFYGRLFTLLVPTLGFFNVVLTAQAHTAAEGQSLDSIIVVLIREGGAWAIVALLLWFYRRDWHRLSDQTEQLISIVEKNAVVHEKVAVALSANTEVLRHIENNLK
jgi:hypothetical protein